ncbi:YiiD C-terminal domain-containing protein [Gracilimonas mengyeensis]|uniref:Thioesterase domain-containing protein, putative n=1 Tax=Gracilimonas mengyeensis TaxID=1302730 RepID=A0A521C1V3_9BACT|nr:YiiD C-terminal domain-containing protein [Gracilimonas mengyeensis]SMO53467.1 thioesterase domain-containing protein, putative [Gracilimonas mengyeensis]
MTKQEIQNYLYENIPVTKALGVEAVAFSREEVKFKAPLAVNINHRSTAFGGSISSLLITTGWSYLRLLFDEHGPVPRIVIGKSSTNYLQPVSDDFTSELIIPKKETLERFWEMYNRFGKTRITLQAKIVYQGVVQAEFEGEFVVFEKEEVRE